MKRILSALLAVLAVSAAHVELQINGIFNPKTCNLPKHKYYGKKTMVNRVLYGLHDVVGFAILAVLHVSAAHVELIIGFLIGT